MGVRFQTLADDETNEQVETTEFVDYWSKLKINECWSEKQRFNKIMNYINEELNSNE